MTLRTIETSDYANIAVPASFGPTPKLTWLSIADLVVDPEYQREITARGRTNVRRIAGHFDWSMFAPVIVAPAGSNRFAIVDGQHRTTAAALCGIERVPCAIIDVGRSIQARAFKAINGNVTRMHTISLHHAAVAAGEEKAVVIAEVCRKAGVTIVRNPTQAELLKVGETVVVNTIGRAIARFGAKITTFGLKTLVSTGGGQCGESQQDHHLGDDRGPERSPRVVQGSEGAVCRLRHDRSRRDLAPGDRHGCAVEGIVIRRPIRGAPGRGAVEVPGQEA
ncbi:ParB N-terminal domain-containing protein [Bradyrhizobium sp. ORS 86]|uniref:ParB N-terminal domain-containing protein n=1 Tax=Bradyrhizobium sp. ORS 86 TaxID=1685970 RepID=UPI00388F463C